MVFASDRLDYNYELYVMNLDGTDVARVTYSGGKDVEPSVSRDGSKIVFVSFRDEIGGEIYSINVDGTGLRRLTHNVRSDGSSLIGTDSRPVWSPDGSQIAFFSWISGGSPGLYKMNADGTGLTRLADAWLGRISWSPDGSKITYSKSQNGFSKTWIVNADGTDARFLSDVSNLSWSPDGSELVGTFYASGGTVAFVSPSTGELVRTVGSFYGYGLNSAVLSADGQKILLSMSQDVNKAELYSINLNGTGFARLTFNSREDVDPSCAVGSTSSVPPPPTGFGRLLLTNGDYLYTMNPTGWDLRRLPKVESIPNLLYQDARWSPDGSRISFESGGDIYVMDADGTNARKVTSKPDNSYYYSGPATWSADGQKLAYVCAFKEGSVNRHTIQILSGFDSATPSSFNLTATGLPREYWPEWNPQVNSLLFWTNEDRPALVAKAPDSPVAPEQVLLRSPETLVYPDGPYYQRGVWNPTGDRIVFTRYENATAGNKEELLMMDANGGNVQHLTNHEFGKGLDDNPSVSPDSTLTDLKVVFTRNVNGGTQLYTLRRTTDDPSGPMATTEFQPLTFPLQSTPEGYAFSAPSSVHWGANFSYTPADEAAPSVTITAPQDAGSIKLTRIDGSATDAGLNASGVAIVWVKYQRLSDGKYWNPAVTTEAEKWSAEPVLLPTRLTIDGSSVNWTITTDLPTTADASPNAQYKISAFAVDAAGNAGAEVSHTFTMIEPGSLTFVSNGAIFTEAYETAGFLDVVVRRDGGSNGAISVDYYSMDGTAMAGQDFSAAAGTLQFADGESEKVIRVSIVQDDVDESSEGFNLFLTNATGGAQIGTSSQLNILILEAPFGEALGAPDFTWTTGTGAGFFGTNWWTTRSVFQSGGSAAKISPTYQGDESWIETTVTGPGTLSFFWKVSSEAGSDRLRVLVDGSQQAEISGEVDWLQKSLPIASGSHTIRWAYTTDSNGQTGGQNTAWLDAVSFTTGNGGGGGDDGGDGGDGGDGSVLDFVGAYHGLIESGPASSLSSGFVSLNVTKTGAFTGKLNLGRTKVSLRGKVDAAGGVTLKPPGKKQPPVVFGLQFDAAGPGLLTGSATLDSGTVVSLSAHRTPSYAKSTSSPFTGNYTVLLPTTDGHGTGFGTLKVNKKGVAKLSMQLPDGTKFVHSASVSADGEWPLYGSFGKRPGALLGWVKFEDLANQSDLHGDVQWFTFATPEGGSALIETRTNLLLEGSSYTPPANDGWILSGLAPGLDAAVPAGAAQLQLEGGLFITSTELDLLLSAARKGKVKVTRGAENPNRITLSIDAKRGIFRGTFKLPDTRGKTSFGGVFFQKQDKAAGFHRAKSGESGSVEILPTSAGNLLE